MSKVPSVNFGLLGEECEVTDFIQLDNVAVCRAAGQIKSADVDDAIAKCAMYVARKVRYALNYRGKPSCIRHTRVFKYHGSIYLADTGEKPYGWLMPNQTLACGFGICFDTSVLCCTLLRLKGCKAAVVLGAVLTTRRRKLRGFHAWVEVMNKEGKLLIVETTSPRKPQIWDAEHVYGGAFANSYEPVCRFNEEYWQENSEKAEKYAELALNVLRKRRRVRV